MPDKHERLFKPPIPISDHLKRSDLSRDAIYLIIGELPLNPTMSDIDQWLDYDEDEHLLSTPSTSTTNHG